MAVGTTARTGYLPGLDGMRALSVLAVLLYHAGMPWLPGGFLGVEVFFVISGYLITMLLVEEFERSRTIAVGRFWLRRAKRLLAALYVLLATVSTFVLVFYREEADELAAQVWAALAYVTNWYLIFSDQSYFALVDRPPVFQHLWSLAIEEQFYLVWPLALLVLLGLTRGRRPVVARFTLIAALASLVWMALLFDPVADPSRVYYSTFTRAGGLLLGATAALLWPPRGDGRRVGPRASAPVGTAWLDLLGAGAIVVLLYCFASVHEYDSFLYRGGFAVVDLAAMVAIVAVVQPGSLLGAVALGNPALTWIGTRSYALYLWHWPIFVFTRPEIDWSLGLYASLVVRLVLTFAAAELSYRYVEVPIRTGALGRWRHRLVRYHGERGRLGPVVLAGVGGLLLLVITVAGSGSGAPSDLERATGIGADAAAATPGVSTVAATGTGSGVPVVPTTVTVLGDSVLAGAHGALEAALTGAGHTVTFDARPAWMLHEVEETLRAAGGPVGEVLVIGLGHNTLWERDRANFDTWADKFDREADALLDTVEALGARRVVWVTLGVPPRELVPALGDRQYEAYNWYFPYVNERLRALVERRPEVTLADWAAVLDREGLIYDAMHLTDDGEALMVQTIRAAASI